MKTCPICRSVAFDDAVTCFGCLHRFSEEDEGTASRVAVPGVVTDGPPSFLIRIKPERERSGLTSWTCSVDLVPA